MADTPVFQGHHVIEQGAYTRSPLLQALSEQRLFDLHGPRNILNLPADPALAARLGLSPHPGGPLSGYSDGLDLQLRRLQQTPDGQATLRGDPAAAERMALRVGELTDTLKTGLVNGDLHSNTPQGMTREQTNQRIQQFFGNLDEYRQAHAPQIAEIGRMPAHEARWAGVTRTEGNVAATLDAIDQSGRPALSERWGGRQSLGTAVAQANEAGRLPLSDAMEVRLRAAFPREMPPTFVRAPTVPEGRGPLVEGGVADVDGPRSGAPGSGRAMRVAGAAGVALMAYDFVSTGHRLIELRSQGNDAGAEAAETRFIGRNAGGLLVGVGAGFLYGAATGSWSGPGALVSGAVGGVVGAYLGDKWADEQQLQQIYTQTDSQGNEWTRDPADLQSQWLRTARAPNEAGDYQESSFRAVGRLVDELNYRSANDSYSLGLANPITPQDPFRLDASTSTQPPRAPFEIGREYVCDARTGQWQLEVREVLDGRIPITRHEPVSDERAAELAQASALIVSNNAANTPAVIAARYQIAYEQFGWNAFASNEPVPEVIRNSAAQTQTLMASDGYTYTRDADGGWATPGLLYGTNPAQGNIREELERTWQSQQAGLREMSGYAEIARANPTPTEYGLRDVVAGAYAQAGLVSSEADIDAATKAVRDDHERAGLGQSVYGLEVRSDGSIETLVGHDDRRMEIKSVTTADEIEQARTRIAAPPTAPQPDAPPPSPVTRPPDVSPPDPAPERHAFDDGRRAGVDAAPAAARAESATPVASDPLQRVGFEHARSDHPPLDDAANPRNGMFQQAFGPVRLRDAELGRASDDASARLAAGMTAEACAGGLKAIRFAEFSPDGRRFYLADTPDPSSPAARTAVGDVAQCLQQSVADSTQRVARIDQAQATAQPFAQSMSPQTPEQTGQSQGPRLA